MKASESGEANGRTDLVIKLVDILLQETIDSRNAWALDAKISSLKALKEALEKFRDNGDASVLNQSLEIENVLNEKTITPLNIAVTFCHPDIAKFLLDNGAKADEYTVHYATKTLWMLANTERMLDVLTHHDVDLNAPREGHTALYYVKRQSCLYPQYNRIATSLARHHATMFAGERVQEPLERMRETVTDGMYKFINGFFPR